MPDPLKLIVSPGAFRLLLAVLVIVSHLSRIYIGKTSVALFFILSGYWIPILWAKINAENNISKYLCNRFLRIYPLYMLVTAVCVGLFQVRLTPSTFLLLGVASTEGPRAIGVEWSLDIEIQFYLAFPALAFLLRKERRGMVALSTLCAAGWAIYLTSGVMTFLQFIPVFVAGMLIHARKVTVSQNHALISLITGIGAFGLAAAIPATRSLAINSLDPPLINSDIFAMAIALLFVPYLAASLRERSNRIDRTWGDLSFPLYLVHEPVIRLYKQVILSPGTHVLELSLFVKAQCAITIIAVAFGVYWLADRPFEMLRRRWLG